MNNQYCTLVSIQLHNSYRTAISLLIFDGGRCTKRDISRMESYIDSGISMVGHHTRNSGGDLHSILVLEVSMIYLYTIYE